jgi:broad-specificity NMP kinase
MKQSILITGVSGAGKSEVSRRLKALGYETHDMDSVEELCVMVDKVTGLPTPYDNSNDIEKMEKMRWLYKKDVLEKIIADQKDEIAFYCGIPSNWEEIVPLFTKVILLTAGGQSIRQRLINRMDNGYGKSVEVQDHILSGKEGVEKDLRAQGAIVVDADKNLDDVVTEVIKAADALANEAMDRGS